MGDYTPPTEAEWKILATEEITHLTDEEQKRFPGDWDNWLAHVKRDAVRQAAQMIREACDRWEVDGDDERLVNEVLDPWTSDILDSGEEDGDE